MAIQFHCPSCDALLSVEDQHVGKQVKCTHCQQTCTAKQPAPEATAIQAPAPKLTADTAAAITETAPKKRRDDDEEERWPPRRRRDVEPASSHSALWIILGVVGLLVGGIVALMCVGFAGGLMFFQAERAAPMAVRPMPAVEMKADEAVVGPDFNDDPVDQKFKKPGAALKVAIVTPRDAVVRGIVKLQGEAPEVKVDPRIAQHQFDAKYCLSGPAKHKAEQLWLVGKDNALANVVVSLAPPPGKKFMIDDQLKAISKKTVRINQPFCAFEPHVVALWPETQGLVFENSATITHNVKIDGGAKIGKFDVTLKPIPKGGAPFSSEEFFLPVSSEKVIDASCGMHAWMNAKIALFPHPYCAVTGEDGGFEIPNVPTGENLTVYLWHESNPRKVEAQVLRTVNGVNELKLEYRR